ncbi:MAG: hypothetical protein EU529_12225 [Promethearchaeota archaeon]|nr:MAG: hypothetical protein EU540_08510 [Candidatus Lokiarchaeota archaeon]TFG21899.1 MAG: hypothetical protein EU529_12225 [Candidatus Lokiarchaeota archaeon]
MVDLDRDTKQIDYPKALMPYDFLIVLSEESAKDIKRDSLKEGDNTGYLIWDPSTINKFRLAKKFKSLRIPVQRMALEKFEDTVYGNSILFGAFTALSKIFSEEAAIETIKNFVPKATLEKNLEAFELGKVEAEYFLKELEGEKK